MMLNQYEFWICTPDGYRIAPLKPYQAGIAMSANAVGAWSMVVSPKTLVESWLADDAVLEFWRKPFMATSKFLASGFLKNIEYYDNNRGTELLEISGPDQNDLLDTRVIAYPSGEATASKTGYADNVAKAYVRENLGSLATDTARDWSARLAVDPDLSLGASMPKAGSYDNLLKLLQDIAAGSNQRGVPLYFGVSPVSGSDGRVTYLFYTSINQPGRDRRSTMTFSRRRHNLEGARLSFLRSSERTVAYVGGPGEGVDRLVRKRQDDTRLVTSIWGRREMFINATNAANADELDAIGDANLYANRPRWKFTGNLLSTMIGSRFGVDWDFGDMAVIDYRDKQFDAMIGKVAISVNRGRERISSRSEVLFYG